MGLPARDSYGAAVFCWVVALPGRRCLGGGNAAIYKPELHIAPVIATACALGAYSNICSLLHSLCFIWPPCDKAQRDKALPRHR